MTDSHDSTLTGKLKSRLALVQSSFETAEVRARQGWGEVPARLRQALSDIAQRLRAGLDIPSGAEVAALADRLEDIDRKLRLLEERRSSDARAVARLEQSASRGDGKSAPGKPRSKPRKQDGGGGGRKRSAKAGDGAGKKSAKNGSGASAKNGGVASAKNGGKNGSGASAKSDAGKNGATPSDAAARKND